MRIEDLQKEIEAIDYWDCQVLDFSINYFGDEIKLVLDSGKNCEEQDDVKKIGYAIRFLLCVKVTYETDAKDKNWRKGLEVKNMNRRQLGHYAQEMEIKESEGYDGFIEVNLNTSLLFAKIICKSIDIQELEYVNTDFFWSKN